MKRIGFDIKFLRYISISMYIIYQRSFEIGGSDSMVIGTGKIYLYADWVHSLKEKRAIVKSIIDKVKNRFNISIAEVENLDMHKSIVLGLACVSNSTRHSDSCIQKVIEYIEQNTEVVVERIETKIL